MNRRPSLIGILFFVSLHTTLQPVLASEFNIKSAHLDMLWSNPFLVDAGHTPKDGELSPVPIEKGLLLRNVGQFSDGRVVFYSESAATPAYRKVLLTNAEHNPEELTELRFKGVPSSPQEPLGFWEKLIGMTPFTPPENPSITSMTIDHQDAIWLGGSTHHYLDYSSYRHSDAYLVKLDKSGKPQWEHAYKTGYAFRIADMAPTSTGNLVVVGSGNHGEFAWIAMIAASDGHMIWDHNLGNSKEISIVPVQGNQFIVGSFDAEGEKAKVTVRSVNENGLIGPVTTIRHAINKSSFAYFGWLSMSATKDGAYILSNWEDSTSDSPVSSEIAKVSVDGKLLWSKAIPDSFKPNNKRHGARLCSEPTVATLPNGDALVACVLEGMIHLHRFDQLTGADQHGTLPLPSCNDGKYPVSLFLTVKSEGEILLSGSRPGNNVGPICSWMGRLISKTSIKQ